MSHSRMMAEHFGISILESDAKLLHERIQLLITEAYNRGLKEKRDEFAVYAVEIARRAIAEEREACANLCWKNQDDNAFVNAYNGKRLDLLCSELIRTRGEND